MKNDDSNLATMEALEIESFVHVEDESNPLTITGAPKHAVIGLNEGMSVTDLCFTLQARELPENEMDRAPVDVIVCLDKSGSMSGRSKLDLSKKTLGLLLRVLLPQDRFGLIIYNHEAQVLVPIRRTTREHKDSASKAIRSLSAGGGTNMSAAVGLAAQEMDTIGEPNPVQTVFFLTDGHANHGISHVEGLVALVQNCFGQLRAEWVVDKTPDAKTCEKSTKQPIKSAPPVVSLHTFGYGVNHNGKLLREMASATEGGSYYFIEEEVDVGKAFGDALGGVLSVVAQNTTVTIDVPEASKEMGVKITKVHHDQTIKRENGSYTVTLGDFYAEETRDLVIEVQLATPMQQVDGPICHAKATVSYTNTLKSTLVRGEEVLVHISRPQGKKLSEENAHVAAQSFRVFAAKEMEEAEKLAAKGHFREAKAKFSSTMDMYSMCSPAVQSSDQTLEICTDAKMMSGYMDDHAAYRGKGQALMSNKVRGHKMQRAAVCSIDTSSTVYKQSKSRSKWSTELSLE